MTKTCLSYMEKKWRLRLETRSPGVTAHLSLLFHPDRPISFSLLEPVHSFRNPEFVVPSPAIGQ